MSVKEKELQIKEDELETKSGHHTPEGLFTKPTKDIVDGLLKDANGDEELALRRITFYINRAGDGLSNKTAVHAAKKELEKKVEAKIEAKNLQIHNMLSEYFTEAYNKMFVNNEGFEGKKQPYWKSIDYLIDNGVNPYWQMAIPRQVLYFAPYDSLMSLSDVYNDGSLGMLIWENGKVAKSLNDVGEPETLMRTITLEEFKTALEDEKNAKVVENFNRHYYDLDTLVDIIANGDKLYNAWIEKFYNDNKEELGLEKLHSYKTHKAFKNFWNELNNYEKSNYVDIADPYGLATKDPRRGMQVGKIRFKASPQRLNGKTRSVIGDVEVEPYMNKELNSDEKRNRMSDKELIKYWLGKSNIDPKYADEPIKDQSGANWRIIKAAETNNNISPVRFQLAFEGNPEFKIIKKPGEVEDMILNYNQPQESINEAGLFNNNKMAQPTINDYNALYDYLQKNDIDPKFCRGAKLYGDLGQEWRITGYNLSDPENPMIAIQSFEKPIEGLNTSSKVMSHKVPLTTIQKWVQKPKNIESKIEWDDIMLDPFQRQKAKASEPDPERKPMKIKNFDKLAARAKHGVI